MDTNFVRIVDTMKAKRTAHYEASNFKSQTNSDHMCVILQNNVPVYFASNVYVLNNPSTDHAEQNALVGFHSTRLRRHEISGKRQKIDILVVRANGGNSRPCERCIKMMDRYTQFYIINNIYYTHPDEPDGIRTVKFSRLLSEGSYSCSYDRNHGKPEFNTDRSTDRSTDSDYGSDASSDSNTEICKKGHMKDHMKDNVKNGRHRRHGRHGRHGRHRQHQIS